MYKLGITGGISSGKTSAAEYLNLKEGDLSSFSSYWKEFAVIITNKPILGLISCR